MEREQFLKQVGLLRAEGNSIRAIAVELAVHRSSIERALKSLRLAESDEQFHSLEHTRPKDWRTKETFIGRHWEVGELKAALEIALSGHGQLIMLAGEPGIGKTRTAQELTTYATRMGVQVLWGRCYEEQGMPPFWPWVQVIRSYVTDRDPSTLLVEMGAGAADIAEVLPEVRDLLPDLPQPPTLEPQQARFRLFDSIARFFNKASQTCPLVLVLDNLHWADPSSLLLLEFLVEELTQCRILVLGTYRDTEAGGRRALSSALGGLARHPHFSQLLLKGLSEEEVSSFIHSKLGSRVNLNLVQAVCTQTEGNPLFVNQVVQLLAQEGEFASAKVVSDKEWRFQIPSGVRDVIRRRLEHLSDRCNQVLLVASVVGREFSLNVLELLLAQPGTALSGGFTPNISSDELLEEIEEALIARVIEETLDTGDGYRFTHVLIQNTLAQQISSARRRRLHLRIG
jgi:predicted ATPase